MKVFDWNPDKNKLLIEERGISFEDVIYHLQNNCLSYIETDEEIFLKTVIPSRKATKQYLGGKP